MSLDETHRKLLLALEEYRIRFPEHPPELTISVSNQTVLFALTRALATNTPITWVLGGENEPDPESGAIV